VPKASEHSSSTINKLLYIGDSATGKTTSLISLVQAGYKLRVYDYDNLLSPLIAKVRLDCPQYLDNIEYMTFRDKLRATPAGPICDGMPRAFVDGLRAMDTWEDGSRPATWGEETIVVIDSLTTMALSAELWARGMQGAAGIAEGVPTKGVEPRAIIYTAQRALMNCIALLTSDAFRANVIVIAHIKYIERDGTLKGFPMAVGTAIGPEIPTYFPAVALATKQGERRTIRTVSTNMIDLKNPNSFDPKWSAELPMDTGLATYFKASKGAHNG